MTCDLQAIRERAKRSRYRTEDVVQTDHDRDDLIAEVDRLRAAIEQHRDQVKSWNIVNREPAPADEHLWSALEDNDA